MDLGSRLGHGEQTISFAFALLTKQLAFEEKHFEFDLPTSVWCIVFWIPSYC